MAATRDPWQTTLKSARANTIYQTVKRELQNEWHNGRGIANHMRHATKSLKTNIKPTSHIYEELGNKRRDIAWIARLRTGHCSRNGYLHRFNIIDDPTCKYGDAPETVKHFLLVCPLYEKERDEMRRKVGVGGMRMEKLLGDLRRVQNTVEFIEKSKRFEF